MPSWIISRLGKLHDRSTFDCGRPMLNDWLKDKAGQFERRDLARTFVATRTGEVVVVGYYAICTHRVLHELLPAAESKKLPRLDIPVVLIARLAVAQSVQRQGLGALLLIDALRRSMQISEQIGIRAVEVDAIDDQAENFYLKFGFRSLSDDRHHLFLPMHEIRKLKLESA
jgi:GNAT superfamily N-acetyltransferase